MKFKNLLKGVALSGVAISATAMFAGCNIFKDEEKLETPSYINQTYSAVVGNSTVEPLMRASTSEDWEKDVVSIKLKENNVAYLVYDLMAYQGVYLENNQTPELDFEITITEDETLYNIQMNINEDTITIKDKSGSETLIGTNPIELGKKDDVLFGNGLYVGLGSRVKNGLTGEYQISDKIEAGSYTYKISDNEIYSCDDVCEASKLSVECIGGQLIYTSQYDRAGEDGETNLFFVEKKGEHSQEFVDVFGDLDYVIYSCEDEGDSISRYYETKATSTTTTLEITQNITFNATKIFKEEWVITNPNTHEGRTEYTYENVSMQLEIKTNGTLTLTITGNSKYNIATNGKWYNIGQKSAQGLLIVLDNKDFFNGYFALGTYDDDNITIHHLLEDEVMSDISATDNVNYEIGWNEESELEIEGREDWVLANN